MEDDMMLSEDKSVAFLGGDEEDESKISTFDYFLLGLGIIVIVIVLSATVSLHLLLHYLHFENGLSCLIPCFFLFVCYQAIFNPLGEKIIAEDKY
jgi:hypothetical protein